MFNIPTVAFDPLVAGWIITALAVLGIISVIAAALGRLPGLLPRVFATLILCLALLNPQTVEESREPLRDEVLILYDISDSINLGSRPQYRDRIYSDLVRALETDGNLEITTASVPTGENGTQLTRALVEQLGNLPLSRLAGVIAITDGQVHDLPEHADKLLPQGVPFHTLVIGDPTGRDRRIRAIVAPKFGVVGEQAEFEIRVDDPGFEGERALVEIKLNGEVKYSIKALIGNRVSIPLEIERRGVNTVELAVQPATDELTTKNNIFVSEISGIRDRMRVLLVTGQPHSGGRAWRNLLKSDPTVDLVHFTILTNPGEKNTNASQNELSLIQFPTRQLFEEKLDEFDLIIFDRFKRRNTYGRGGRVNPILPPYYFQNIANYVVEDGGALLIATGPAFAGENSLSRSLLSGVLPARPTGDIAEYGFTPKLNDKGRRHPVTAPFFGNDDQNWSRWFRVVESDVVSGHILMEGEAGEPLLVLEKVGDGRVGMVMSDQAWLWSRNFEGGGPYNELFRRVAHWLLGEPDLDAEKLVARSDGDTVTVERRTLGDGPWSVMAQYPDGTEETLNLRKVEDGLYRAQVKNRGQGAYRLTSGDISTVTAIGALNPREFARLAPTLGILEPLSRATNGYAGIINPKDTLPALRRIAANANIKDRARLNLIVHNDYVVRTSRRTALAPGWLFFALALLTLAWAWRREGQ
ncbi:MAG: hypothetical protein GDA35_09445 [Hyphomonadaceae bacterium]|nr:hypothetical protein [Hyphomonadaceae bacterium]